MCALPHSQAARAEASSGPAIEEIRLRQLIYSSIPRIPPTPPNLSTLGSLQPALGCSDVENK